MKNQVIPENMPIRHRNIKSMSLLLSPWILHENANNHLFKKGIHY